MAHPRTFWLALGLMPWLVGGCVTDSDPAASGEPALAEDPQQRALVSGSEDEEEGRLADATTPDADPDEATAEQPAAHPCPYVRELLRQAREQQGQQQGAAATRCPFLRQLRERTASQAATGPGCPYLRAHPGGTGRGTSLPSGTI